jgi:hypothetical protein
MTLILRLLAGHPPAFLDEVAMTAAAMALPPGAAGGADGVCHGIRQVNPHTGAPDPARSASPTVHLSQLD